MSRQCPVMDTHFHLGVNPLIYFDDDDLMDWMQDNKIDIQVIMQAVSYTHLDVYKRQ